MSNSGSIFLDSQIEEFMEMFPKEMTKRMHTCCYAVQDRARESMRNTTKSSKGVRRSKNGKMHYPSDPYNPPAIDTGQLAKNVVTEVENVGGNIIGRVGVPGDVYYTEEGSRTSVGDVAVMLEFGTSKMLPRPFLEPAFVHQSAKVKRILGAPIDEI